MTTKLLMKLALCLALLIATAGMATANGPELMVYSGSIPQGVNQGDGFYDISFSIYASEQGGPELWSETQNVYVYRGTFGVYLGAVQKLNLAFDVPYWVGVKAGDKEDILPLTGAGYPVAGYGDAAAAGETGIVPAVVAADEVLSANIKEADGTSGQNTNSGSGIKTDHIQNGSVTTSKLKADAVVTAKIADGAVTDAKITGPIAPSKIEFTGLNADMLDGSHAAAFSLTGHNHDAAYVNVGGDTMTGRLRIKGNGWPSSFLFLDTNAAAQDSGIRFYENGTVKSHLYWNAVLANLRLYGSGFSGIDITSIGRVGIGTTAPSAKLHAATDSGTGIYGTSITGRGVYAYGEGTTVNAPALFAYNSNATAAEPAGIAIYARNNGGDATVVARNTGTGDTFRSINAAGDRVMFRVTTTGRVVTSAVQIYGGGDLAERFEVRKPKADMTPAPGMVVSIDPDNPGKLMVSRQAYDKTVAGIISGAGGIESGMIMAQEGTIADGSHAVALTGRVYCLADASKGAIKPGDLLTSADVPGYAMKATDYFKAQGAIIGKAMSSLSEGQGMVLVLVTLQ